jgi:hypothetical protein
LLLEYARQPLNAADLMEELARRAGVDNLKAAIVKQAN